MNTPRPQSKICWGYIELAVGSSLSVQMSHEPICSLTNKMILMKLYTVAVYFPRMSMKEDNPGPDYFKGDNYLCGVVS